MSVLVGLGALLILGMTVASMLPTDVRAVSAEYQPFEKRGGRKPNTTGCGLNRVADSAGACKSPSVSGARHEEVRFASRLKDKGLAELQGTLSIPEGLSGPRPAVVLIHGSGPADRDLEVPGGLVHKLSEPFPVLKKLGEWFTQQGFVVLRYDKRACVRCYKDALTLDPQKFSFHDFVVDAKDALAFLRGRPEVDRRALVVAGVSQGGGLAPHVAADEQGIAAVVALAPALESFSGGLLKQLDQIAEIRARQYDYIGKLNVQLKRGELSRCFEQLSDPNHDPQAQCIGGGVTQRALAEYDVLSARTPALLRALEVPVFAAHGTVDRNCDPAIFSQVADSMADRDAEFHLIAGMDHVQTEALAPGPPQLHPALLQRLERFLAQVGPAAVPE